MGRSVVVRMPRLGDTTKRAKVVLPQAVPGHEVQQVRRQGGKSDLVAW